MADEPSPSKLPGGLASFSVGWRVVVSLGGLALLMVVIVSVLGQLADRNRSTGLDAIQNAPWIACAREAARQLSAPGLRVVGPMETRWAASGDAVEMSGVAGGAGLRLMRFACHAVHRKPGWLVERLLFTQ